MSMADSQRRIDQFFHRRDSSTAKDSDTVHSSDQDELEDESDSESETDEAVPSSPTDSSTSEICECQCCSKVSTPHHPVELRDSKDPFVSQ